MAKDIIYQGFEQGPIRPPSEAGSLLIRVTRNCPWNRCSFCPVYKEAKFSKRPLDHILKDIDLIYDYICQLKLLKNDPKVQTRSDLISSIQNRKSHDITAFNAALNWFYQGMHSIFLQDADSLMIDSSDILDILKQLRKHFPNTKRITSYARSKTICKKSLTELKAFQEAGLNRIHIGLESGSNIVLEKIKKGVTPELHIEAGQKVIEAGMELSEYVMPGLGGQTNSKIHAIETANVLNQINPHFIRLRSLAIPESIDLYKELEKGTFIPLSDNEIVSELRILLTHLDGIQSRLKSDHILNLFEDLEGTLPDDKQRMLDILDHYQALPEFEKMVYRIGRRSGLFQGLSHLNNTSRRRRAEQIIEEYGVTLNNIDEKISAIIGRFI